MDDRTLPAIAGRGFCTRPIPTRPEGTGTGAVRVWVVVRVASIVGWVDGRWLGAGDTRVEHQPGRERHGIHWRGFVWGRQISGGAGGDAGLLRISIAPGGAAEVLREQPGG